MLPRLTATESDSNKQQKAGKQRLRREAKRTGDMTLSEYSVLWAPLTTLGTRNSKSREYTLKPTERFICFNRFYRCQFNFCLDRSFHRYNHEMHYAKSSICKAHRSVSKGDANHNLDFLAIKDIIACMHSSESHRSSSKAASCSFAACKSSRDESRINCLDNCRD